MLKPFALLALLVLNQSTFAAAPDFVCQDESNFRYEFSYRKNVGISIFDDQAEALDELNQVEFNYQSINTLPARDHLTFRSTQDGSVIAIVEFEAGEKAGHGELSESLTKLSCSR